MSNLSEAQAFEQKLKQFIDEPKPEPKYQQWQSVRYRHSKQERRVGSICGAFFTRVAIAYETSTKPGWYYYVEIDFEHTIVHEDEILEVV